MADAAMDPVPLQRVGLRATAHRVAVLAVLAEAGGHRSADELVAVLADVGHHQARTTVYNALQDLARAGLVREAPVMAGALHYEADVAPHHHFVCRHCGLIINVPISDNVRVPADPCVGGVEVETVEVVYRGLCQRCSRATIDPKEQGPHAAQVERSARAPAHRDEAVAVVRGQTSDRL
jgi:Fe2+ or Zn2+ uptake regulation protein